MAREEWKTTDSYQKRNQANGIFTEWPAPSEVVEGKGAETPGKNKARDWKKGTKP